MKAFHLILLIGILQGCKINHNMTQNSNNNSASFTPLYTPGPPALVYKTKINYNNQVPVILSEDKSKIVAYPDPSDIRMGNDFPYPTVLNNGYLLDNRGIGKNVAFLKITYKEYSKLSEAPSVKELYSMILDKDPLTELCNCGNRNAFTDIMEQLNELINNHTLRTTCKSIK